MLNTAIKYVYASESSFFKAMDVFAVPAGGLFHVCFQKKHIKEAGL